ncbi:MAG TPA: phosphodiesterase, partial [Halococcus sp.]|nr:phosphodiesterase [Halococcus sp.]
TEPYNHKREGIVAAAGEGLSTEKSLSGAHLFDVAPTVLAALSLPRGEHMDGEVLPIVESVGEQTYPELDERTRETTDEQAVEARLTDLGYLE